MSLKVSRRMFLKQTGMAGAGILMSGLAGCVAVPAPADPATAGEPATASQGEVSLMYYTSTTPAVARMEKQEQGFKEKHPEVALTIIQEPSDPDGKLKVMWAAGTQPDVFWAGLATLSFAYLDVFLSLDDLIAADEDLQLDAYYPQVVDGFRWDGKLYALPYGFTTSVWFYNKALFDAKDVSYPTDDWTLAEFQEAAIALSEGDVWGVADLWVVIGNWMAGGSLWDADFTGSAINTPQTLSALTWNRDFRMQDKAMPPLDVLQEQGAIAMFQNQKAALVTLGRWGLPVAVAIENFDWDIAAFPTPAQGERGTWISYEGYAITSRTQDPDSAWKLVKYLCDADAQENFYLPEGSAIPAIRAVAESAAFGQPAPGKNHDAYLKSVEFAKSPGSHPAALRVIQEPWQSWGRVLDGSMEVEDFCQEADEQMNAVIKDVLENRTL